MKNKDKWNDFIDATNFKKYPKTAVFGLTLFIVSLILLASVSWKVPVGLMLFLWSQSIDKMMKRWAAEDKATSGVYIHIPKGKGKS